MYIFYVFQVNENFGGVTISQGGTRWFSLSAGYVGSVIWGCFFILMTWDRLGTKIAAGVFIFACLVTAIVLTVQVSQVLNNIPDLHVFF